MGPPAPRSRPSDRLRAAYPPPGDPHARIHICPVGFEVERVTEPILRERADRVYLVTRREDDRARPFLEEVIRRIRRAPRPVEVEIRRAEIWDVFGALGAYRAIFEREARIDRRAAGIVPIRVNVSTGTKITAIAGTLACMLWKGEPYYAQVSRSWYSGITPKVRAVNDVVERIDPVGVYELRAPAPELIDVLRALARRGGELRKRDLIRELGLDRAGGPGAPSPQAQHSRLRRRLDPLESKWGFVAAGSGGGRVRLTPQGRLALGLFGGSTVTPPAAVGGESHS
ncbi:MAG: DUF6293 family protein [Thermoplasmata archaeon]